MKTFIFVFIFFLSLVVERVVNLGYWVSVDGGTTKCTMIDRCAFTHAFALINLNKDPRPIIDLLNGVYVVDASSPFSIWPGTEFTIQSTTLGYTSEITKKPGAPVGLVNKTTSMFEISGKAHVKFKGITFKNVENVDCVFNAFNADYMFLEFDQVKFENVKPSKSFVTNIEDLRSVVMNGLTFTQSSPLVSLIKKNSEEEEDDNKKTHVRNIPVSLTLSNVYDVSNGIVKLYDSKNVMSMNFSSNLISRVKGEKSLIELKALQTKAWVINNTLYSNQFTMVEVLDNVNEIIFENNIIHNNLDKSDVHEQNENEIGLIPSNLVYFFSFGLDVTRPLLFQSSNNYIENNNFGILSAFSPGYSFENPSINNNYYDETTTTTTTTTTTERRLLNNKIVHKSFISLSDDIFLNNEIKVDALALIYISHAWDGPATLGLSQLTVHGNDVTNKNNLIGVGSLVFNIGGQLDATITKGTYLYNSGGNGSSISIGDVNTAKKENWEGEMNIEVNDVLFANNSVTSIGGALFISRAHANVRMRMNNCKFEHNKAGNAGAMFIRSYGTDSQVNLTSSTFRHNFANRQFGGALILYLDRCTNPECFYFLIRSNSTRTVDISHNRAAAGGGGIYFVSTFLKDYDPKIVHNNSAFTIEGNNVLTSPMTLTKRYTEDKYPDFICRVSRHWIMTKTGPSSKQPEKYINCTSNKYKGSPIETTVRFFDGWDTRLTQTTLFPFSFGLTYEEHVDGSSLVNSLVAPVQVNWRITKDVYKEYSFKGTKKGVISLVQEPKINVYDCFIHFVNPASYWWILIVTILLIGCCCLCICGCCGLAFVSFVTYYLLNEETSILDGLKMKKYREDLDLDNDLINEKKDERTPFAKEERERKRRKKLTRVQREREDYRAKLRERVRKKREMREEEKNKGKNGKDNENDNDENNEIEKEKKRIKNNKRRIERERKRKQRQLKKRMRKKKKQQQQQQPKKKEEKEEEEEESSEITLSDDDEEEEKKKKKKKKIKTIVPTEEEILEEKPIIEKKSSSSRISGFFNFFRRRKKKQSIEKDNDDDNDFDNEEKKRLNLDMMNSGSDSDVDNNNNSSKTGYTFEEHVSEMDGWADDDGLTYITPSDLEKQHQEELEKQKLLDEKIENNKSPTTTKTIQSQRTSSTPPPEVLEVSEEEINQNSSEDEDPGIEEVFRGEVPMDPLPETDENLIVGTNFYDPDVHDTDSADEVQDQLTMMRNNENDEAGGGGTPGGSGGGTGTHGGGGGRIGSIRAESFGGMGTGKKINTFFQDEVKKPEKKTKNILTNLFRGGGGGSGGSGISGGQPSFDDDEEEEEEEEDVIGGYDDGGGGGGALGKLLGAFQSTAPPTLEPMGGGGNNDNIDNFGGGGGGDNNRRKSHSFPPKKKKKDKTNLSYFEILNAPASENDGFFKTYSKKEREEEDYYEDPTKQPSSSLKKNITKITNTLLRRKEKDDDDNRFQDLGDGALLSSSPPIRELSREEEKDLITDIIMPPTAEQSEIILTDDEDEAAEEREARERAAELKKLMEMMDQQNKKFEEERKQALRKQREIRQKKDLESYEKTGSLDEKKKGGGRRRGRGRGTGRGRGRGGGGRGPSGGTKDDNDVFFQDEKKRKKKKLDQQQMKKRRTIAIDRRRMRNVLDNGGGGGRGRRGGRRGGRGRGSRKSTSSVRRKPKPVRSKNKKKGDSSSISFTGSD